MFLLTRKEREGDMQRERGRDEGREGEMRGR
jgi:hypothetical protein